MTDWQEAQSVYQVRGWKSCLLLCGGILEGMLLDALAHAGSAPTEAECDLPSLLQIARDQGILETGAPPPGLVFQDFRHLVHPGRPMSRRIEVTMEEAGAALAVVRTCLRQIAAKRTGQAGQH